MRKGSKNQRLGEKTESVAIGLRQANEALPHLTRNSSVVTKLGDHLHVLVKEKQTKQIFDYGSLPVSGG